VQRKSFSRLIQSLTAELHRIDDPAAKSGRERLLISFKLGQVRDQGIALLFAEGELVESVLVIEAITLGSV